MPRASRDAAPSLITAEGLRKLNEELAALEDDGRRRIAEQIRTALESFTASSELQDDLTLLLLRRQPPVADLTDL